MCATALVRPLQKRLIVGRPLRRNAAAHLQFTNCPRAVHGQKEECLRGCASPNVVSEFGSEDDDNGKHDCYDDEGTHGWMQFCAAQFRGTADSENGIGSAGDAFVASRSGEGAGVLPGPEYSSGDGEVGKRVEEAGKNAADRENAAGKCGYERQDERGRGDGWKQESVCQGASGEGNGADSGAGEQWKRSEQGWIGRALVECDLSRRILKAARAVVAVMPVPHQRKLA